jgi:hypothetical protein
MLSNKILTNKFYLYADVLHKVKKIQKKNGKIFLENMKTGEEVVIPSIGADVLLSRMYTIGEVAKIAERRSDTIRKYERSGLIPKPVSFGEDYVSYKNWRFYTYSDVYEILQFFSDRSPGRPAKEKPVSERVDSKINMLNQKVKMTARSFNNARI